MTGCFSVRNMTRGEAVIREQSTRREECEPVVGMGKRKRKRKIAGEKGEHHPSLDELKFEKGWVEGRGGLHSASQAWHCGSNEIEKGTNRLNPYLP